MHINNLSTAGRSPERNEISPTRCLTPGTVLPSPSPACRNRDGEPEASCSRVPCSVKSRHHCSSIAELTKALDLSHLPDDEFFLIPPNELPRPSSSDFTSEDPSGDLDAMEMEAITSSFASFDASFPSLSSTTQGNRSRSVSMGTEDARSMSPGSDAASRFRIPGLALQPRCNSAPVPWQPTHSPSTS